MTPTLDQLQEARTALGSPLFSDLPGDIEISFEFFPPKSEKMAETLWNSVATLAPLGPRFVSVTYGAGGTTRERTHEQVVRINQETQIPAAAHLTCVNATREEVDAVARHYWESGIRHIVALRGDAPDGASSYSQHPGGYANAVELIAQNDGLGSVNFPNMVRTRDGVYLAWSQPAHETSEEADRDDTIEVRFAPFKN